MSRFTTWSGSFLRKEEKPKNREETPKRTEELPKKAVKERVVNAIVHADDIERAIDDIVNNGVDSSSVQAPSFKKSDLEAYQAYHQKKRNAHIQKARDQVSAYDSDRTKKNPEYKAYSDNIAHEVDDADDDPDVDRAMDIQQREKLDVFNGVEVVSEKEKKRLDEQEAVFKQRALDRNAAIEQLRSKINTFDQEQKRDGFKSFDEQRKDNQAATTSNQDDCMDIFLMEKLGILTNDVKPDVQKQIVTERSKLDDKLKSHNARQLETLNAITSNINKYDSSNEGRIDYHKFRNGEKEADNVKHYF